jgi:hypothetical protein
MMMITIKGIGESLQVFVIGEDWNTAYPSLLEALSEQSDFFHGARIALNVDSIDLDLKDLKGLIDELSGRDIHLRAIYSKSELTLDSASHLGIAHSLPSEQLDNGDEPCFDIELLGEEAIFLQRTLRSGQSIHYCTCWCNRECGCYRLCSGSLPHPASNRKLYRSISRSQKEN